MVFFKADNVGCKRSEFDMKYEDDETLQCKMNKKQLEHLRKTEEAYFSTKDQQLDSCGNFKGSNDSNITQTRTTLFNGSQSRTSVNTDSLNNNNPFVKRPSPVEFDPDDIVNLGEEGWNVVINGPPLYSPFLGTVRVISSRKVQGGTEYIVSLIDPFNQQKKSDGPFYRGMLGKEFKKINAIVYSVPDIETETVDESSPVTMLVRKSKFGKSRGEKEEITLGKLFNEKVWRMNPEYKEGLDKLMVHKFKKVQELSDIIEKTKK